MTRAATFWDRRRAAVQAEEVASQQKVGAEADVLQAAEQAEKTDTELLAEFNLPDPDTLKAGDDFSVFMAKSVPTHLRQRALRKLWVSNPVLACLDDLVDYADDYTQASARTCFETSYQVGKGLRRHVEEVMRANAATEVDEMAESALFYFADDVSYEEKAAKKILKPAAVEALRLLIDQFEKLEDFSEANLETAFKTVMDQTGLKLGKIAQPFSTGITE